MCPKSSSTCSHSSRLRHSTNEVHPFDATSGSDPDRGSLASDLRLRVRSPPPPLAAHPTRQTSCYLFFQLSGLQLPAATSKAAAYIRARVLPESANSNKKAQLDFPHQREWHTHSPGCCCGSSHTPSKIRLICCRCCAVDATQSSSSS